MLIFKRWGFLSFLALGAGILTAVSIAQAQDLGNGPLVSALCFALAAGYNLLLVVFVYRWLDRPRPVLDDDGHEPPLLVVPRSTLFFVPVGMITLIYLGIALIMGVIALFQPR